MEISVTKNQKLKKLLLLKTVHCTHFLRPTKCKFILKQKNEFGNWYTYDYKNQEYGNVVTTNENTWICNPCYELKQKNFQGVVVKIDSVFISKLLGVHSVDYKWSQKPCRKYIYNIQVAIVYFGNGLKRTVPLSCIEEYPDFNAGKEILEHYADIERLNNPANQKTTFCIINTKEKIKSIPIKTEQPSLFPEFSTDKDKTSIKLQKTLIKINHKHIYQDCNNFKLKTNSKTVILDVLNHKVRLSNKTECLDLPIDENSYNEIKTKMKSILKEKYGFAPDIEYGESNMRKLINYCLYPFCPQLAEIEREICGEKAIISELKEDFEGEKAFIKACGIEYSPMVNILFQNGIHYFFEYLGIWHAGFKNIDLIKKLMEADEDLQFASIVRQYGNLNKFSSVWNFTIYGWKFTIDEQNYHNYKAVTIIKKARLFLKVFDETTAYKFIKHSLENTNNTIENDGFDYFFRLYDERLLAPRIIKKIAREGITDYNHDMLMNCYEENHPEKNININLEISYTDEEKKLEFEQHGFQFQLPENTNKLLEIGSKMNICVGHLYREKAVEKRCTIVYAKKGEEYKLCIELLQTENKFKLIQKSAFNNSSPKGETLFIFNSWCERNNIIT